MPRTPTGFHWNPQDSLQLADQGDIVGRIMDRNPDGKKKKQRKPCPIPGKAALNDARDDPRSWWHVARLLSVGDFRERGDDLLSSDLAARPGWSLLGDQERHDVLDLGVRYLAVHELRPSAWDGRHPVDFGEALPDWSGAYLLMTLARHDPDRIRALDPPTWSKWAPAIVGAWVSAPDDG